MFQSLLQHSIQAFPCCSSDASDLCYSRLQCCLLLRTMPIFAHEFISTYCRHHVLYYYKLGSALSKQFTSSRRLSCPWEPCRLWSCEDVPWNHLPLQEPRSEITKYLILSFAYKQNFPVTMYKVIYSKRSIYSFHILINMIND